MGRKTESLPQIVHPVLFKGRIMNTLSSTFFRKHLGQSECPSPLREHKQRRVVVKKIPPIISIWLGVCISWHNRVACRVKEGIQGRRGKKYLTYTVLVFDGPCYCSIRWSVQVSSVLPRNVPNVCLDPLLKRSLYFEVHLLLLSNSPDVILG